MNEMICVQEAVKAGEEYCPVQSIIEVLEECMKFVDTGNLPVPTEDTVYNDTCR